MIWDVIWTTFLFTNWTITYKIKMWMNQNLRYLRFSTCPLTSFFWLLSHVIYLKLTKILYECLLSQAEWWVAELLFLSLNNWGLNFLQNKCSQSSQIYLSPEKLRKVFTFQSCKFLNDKIDQNINFAKLPSAKYFWYNLQFYYPSHSFGKEDTLILLLSAWDRSCDSTAKRNLSKDM